MGYGGAGAGDASLRNHARFPAASQGGGGGSGSPTKRQVRPPWCERRCPTINDSRRAHTPWNSQELLEPLSRWRALMDCAYLHRTGFRKPSDASPWMKIRQQPALGNGSAQYPRVKNSREQHAPSRRSAWKVSSSNTGAILRRQALRVMSRRLGVTAIRHVPRALSASSARQPAAVAARPQNAHPSGRSARWVSMAAAPDR